MNAGELFEVWRDTYQMQTFEGLIFGKDAVAYRIEAKPLRLGDLKEFDPDDKIINQFEEILRHNNVSDNENAFNRLIALFICKLVDETNKATAPRDQGAAGDAGDVLEFQYKIGTDDYETLQDRLQRLHRDGMRDFMNETVTYVEDNYAEKLFARYEGENRYKVIEDIRDTMKRMLWCIGEEGELCYDATHDVPTDTTNRVKGSLWE